MNSRLTVLDTQVIDLLLSLGQHGPSRRVLSGRNGIQHAGSSTTFLLFVPVGEDPVKVFREETFSVNLDTAR
jgi:hypothetical protein